MNLRKLLLGAFLEVLPGDLSGVFKLACLLLFTGVGENRR